MTSDPSVADVRERWRAAWPDALAAWGRHLRLRAPRLLDSAEVPRQTPSFAWFSVRDVEVGIDLDLVVAKGLQGLPVEILAHEIGHYVYSPGDLTTSARLIARTGVGLADRGALAGTVANLWSDLLINDRLQRRSQLQMDTLWTTIGPPAPEDVIMQFVMRTNELLWSLQAGTLTTAEASVPEREAQLCARAVRAYADDPVGGAAGFAALVRQLLPVGWDERAAQIARLVVCGQHEPAGGSVPGLAGDDSLAAPALHPALDPRVVRDLLPTAPAADAAPSAAAIGNGDGDNQTVRPSTPHGLDPAEYAAVLTVLGVQSDAALAAADWYREKAAPYLVPFPLRPQPLAPQELLGGLEPWTLGDDISAIDWPGSLLAGPQPIPGITLVQRTYERDDATERWREPVDLDLYLDSSGSIPNPQAVRSPLALAGTILALSALRAGARVQATTWSGPGDVAGTDGFTDNIAEVLAAIVAYFGGGTAFPVERLLATHVPGHRRTPISRLDRAAGSPGRKRHIAVVSDDGVETMFRREGLAGRALEAAGGGGTLVLRVGGRSAQTFERLAAPYRVHAVNDWEDVQAFAHEFAQQMWDLSMRGAQ